LNADKQNASHDHVRLAMTGDHDAIQLVIQNWYRRVYARCRAQLISAADAEDATQETFLRGFAQLDQLRSPDALGGWLRGIAHHVCVDVIRRNQKSGSTIAVEPAADSNAESTDQVERADQQEHLVGLIHTLPEPLREVILLHYYDEMTYDEIAEWLAVARSTVNERLSKARNLLRRELLLERCSDEM
jgi:RNA polymerase sigma-70 factor (ECF subfamily)